DAQTSLRPTIATPVRKLSPAPKFGVGTAPHAPPFQCIANVRAIPSEFRVAPTAHASDGLTASTSLRKVPPEPIAGVRTCRHAPSSYRRASERPTPLLSR